VLTLALAAPLAVTAVSHAAITATAAEAHKTAAHGYLGIELAAVPESLRAQLGPTLPPGQGILVMEIQNNSAAAKAGLKTYDILIGYDDQKLYSAEQLSQLVRSDLPGKRVTLHYVRSGAVQNTQAALGELIAARTGNAERGMRWHGWLAHRAQPMAAPTTGNWENFDSISLKKLEDGNFKAEIQYLDKDRKLVKQSYSGTLDAIREQIGKQQDLPATERQQLLDTLSAREEFPFPRPEWFNPRIDMSRWFNWPPNF
jgi:membrane-associated protease RseP (regulator of RpoE activity)